METITQPIDASAWREDFFPPLNAWRWLARAAAVLLLFLLWVALALAMTAGLMHSGWSLDVAALLGLLMPPLLMIVLNIAGVFHHPRGDQRNLKTFQRWITGPSGQRRGLAPEHLGQVQPKGHNTLMIEVTPAWLEQPADKRLADVSHWFIVWDFCRDEHADRTRLELSIQDQAGQMVGGSQTSPDDSVFAWVFVEDGTFP